MPGPCNPYLDDGTQGEVLVVTTATFPTGGDLYAGRLVYNISTGTMWYYDGTNWNQLNGEIICTSSTRPTGAALHDGLRIFETDTKENLVYYSAAAVWRRPWMMPWGILTAPVALSGDQETSGTTLKTLITAGTITVVANRRIKATLSLSGYGSVAGDDFEFRFNDAGGTRWQAYTEIASSGLYTPVPYNIVGFLALAAGSTSLKAEVYRASGTGIFHAESSYSSSFVLEDIGPTSAVPA